MGKETKTTAGRPSLGVTKKVSITLLEEDWKWIEEKGEGNSSQFFRKIVGEVKQSERL